MHVDTGDSPCPICQKPYTLPLKHYSWVQQEIKTLEYAGLIRKSISPWASPIVMVPKKSAPGEPPRHRICIDFRKINELQPKTQRVDKKMDIQGNLSLILLPKIDEMHAQICVVLKYSPPLICTVVTTTSDWTNSLGAKTAFVTPFGKYELNAVPFWFGTGPCIFSTINFNYLAGLSKFCDGIFG